MKMSDRFYLPIEVARPCNTSELRDGVGDYLFDVDADDIDVAAICVAINNHDALVEALEKMSSVLFHLSNEPSLCNEKRIACRGDFEYLAKLLVKARGES